MLASNSSIKIIPPQSKFDSSHNYFKTLLELILYETNANYPKKDIEFSKKMEQGRAFVALKKGKLDIHWAGTSLNREKQFLAIRIPLVKGLLGYRFFIIDENKKDIFNSVETLENLKQLKACQGTYWPDTKILENAKLKVVKNPVYEAMFLQVQKGRCDYFPRGVHEIVSEVKSRKDRYKELVMYEDMIVYYPFPMYFFVSKENKALANRIEQGLLKLIESKKFDEYIQNHEVTKHLFPIENWINKKTFVLENPFMNKDEKYFNSKFWIFK